MPPKGVRSGPQPKPPPPRSRDPRDHRSVPSPASPLAREDARIADFEFCRNGFDGVESAYRAHGANYYTDIEQEYQLHSADPESNLHRADQLTNYLHDPDLYDKYRRYEADGMLSEPF